jgi:hypothetical protein
MLEQMQEVLGLEKHAFYSTIDDLYSFARFDPTPRRVVDDDLLGALGPAQDSEETPRGSLCIAHLKVLPWLGRV